MTNKKTTDLFKVILPEILEADSIMKKPCKHCPTAHYPPDEEVQEILKLPHEEQIKTAFTCGWNPRKYCKGYCTLINATEKELGLYPHHQPTHR